MACSIRRAEYDHATIADRPGAAYDFLSELADQGIHLLAFTAAPAGPDHVHLTHFSEDPPRLETEAGRAGLALEGPQEWPGRLWNLRSFYGALSSRRLHLPSTPVRQDR
ncbi:MAG TPA: hypothetical protein VLL48_10400 [Longimicrobiales bacterium]|nr:hypothetical protein [Longimicrobiales bacterium]